MYDALRDFMAADFQEAENKGKMKMAKEAAVKLAKMGLSFDKIADVVEVSEKQIEEWLSESPVIA